MPHILRKVDSLQIIQTFIKIGEEELEDGIDAEQSTPPGESDQVIGECKSCGIQLRDWSSTQSHLRFHRLSHVPYCINWSSCVAPQTKR